MISYYISADLVKDKSQTLEQEAMVEAMYRVAQPITNHTRWARMLVKLSGMLIRLGVNIRSYAEKDISRHFPVASFKHM